MINEKTSLKSNSLESKIVESLIKIVQKQAVEERDKDIIEISNDILYSTFQQVTDAEYHPNDNTYSTFYLPMAPKCQRRK